jgi:progressive ankylosis protein
MELTQMTQLESTITYRRLCSFFIPLGISASLVTISHSIINSTLARSANPEMIIAAYAIAMSMLGILERPAVLLRQTCSALVRDRISYQAMTKVTLLFILGILGVGLIICYSPLGTWLFLDVVGVQPEMLDSVLATYRILMFVSVFSSTRSLFHGILISNMQTKWLTIGMIVRLSVMYLFSLYFLHASEVTHPRVGAIIFASGMAVEALVALREGRKLARTLPDKKPDHPIETGGHIFKFFRPLLLSSFIAVIIMPTVNAMLGKTMQIELAIASFAIAANITQLAQSFFSYLHQIVLNFYEADANKVKRFALFLSLMPAAIVGIMGYTPIGTWFLSSVMGVGENLLIASIYTLRVFMITSIIFPWLDFCNGIVMLRGQTKIMFWSQVANVIVTVIVLVICVAVVPHWNGMIGALGQSLGVVAELGFILYVLMNPSGGLGRLPRPGVPRGA